MSTHNSGAGHTPDRWRPMRTAPKDGTVVQLCELNYPSGKGLVMPGCWMAANGDPRMEGFWAAAPTSRVPTHLMGIYPNPDGKAVGWREIALTPLCWKPLAKPESVASLKRRFARATTDATRAGGES